MATNCLWPGKIRILKAHLLYHLLASRIFCFYSYFNGGKWEVSAGMGYGNMKSTKVSCLQDQEYSHYFHFKKNFQPTHLSAYVIQSSLNLLFKIYRKLRSGRGIWGGLSYLVQSILVNEKFDLRRTNRHSPDPLILKAYILSLME